MASTSSTTPPEEGIKSLNLRPDAVETIDVVEFCVLLPSEIDGVDVPSSFSTERGVVG